MSANTDCLTGPAVRAMTVCRLISGPLAIWGVILLTGGQALTAGQAADADVPAELKAEAEAFFRKRVTPFIRSYCLECHQNSRPTEAGLSFTPALDTPGHAAFSEKWKKSAARVKAHDMPPEGAEQPTDEERQMFESWLGRVKYLSPRDPGVFVIRRLTRTEYGNTLHDLFGVDPAVADRLPEEVSGAGYLNSLSPLQLEQYLSIADDVLDQILPEEGSPAATTKTSDRSPHRPSGDSTAKGLRSNAAFDPNEFLRAPPERHRQAAKETAASLAKRIYRRPPTQDELKVLLDVYDLGPRNDLSWSASMRLMLRAMLVSPQFLFITPSDGASEATAAGASEAADIVPLDDYQLASRLSYLLWSTMPDEQLTALADSGSLQQPEVLREQVKRMLQDPRSRALFDGFGAQWLGVGDLGVRTFDTKLFPQMTDSMRSAMYDEARLFFEHLIRENRSVAEFIDSDYTFLNEDLAQIYGLNEDEFSSDMRRFRLADPNRGGLLGMPGVLAATSFPDRTSPVIRGVWVLEQVLGEHVPSAPPDVPSLEQQDQKSVAGLTLRQRTELHRTDPVCANCHQLLDPIGFGLENFDAVGRWRDQDAHGRAIDAAGELPDGSRFTTPQELKAVLAGRLDDFARNLAEKLLAYALCRRLEGYDEIVVDRLMDDIAADGYRMQTLVTSVVTSYPFTHRRIIQQNEQR